MMMMIIPIHTHNLFDYFHDDGNLNWFAILSASIASGTYRTSTVKGRQITFEKLILVILIVKAPFDC